MAGGLVSLHTIGKVSRVSQSLLSTYWNRRDLSVADVHNGRFILESIVRRCIVDAESLRNAYHDMYLGWMKDVDARQ